MTDLLHDDPAAGLGYLDLVASDLRRFRPGAKTSWLSVLIRVPGTPGVLASLVFRAQQCLVRAGHGRLATQLTTLGIWLVGLDVSAGAVAGPGLAIVHPQGVVIGAGARLGSGVTLTGGVTLAAQHARLDHEGEQPFPVVGDHVTLGSHAVLVGAVTVGDHAVVGANSVVLDDVEARGVAVGSPARVVRLRSAAETREAAL